jgi:hypothetical protein
MSKKYAVNAPSSFSFFERVDSERIHIFNRVSAMDLRRVSDWHDAIVHEITTSPRGKKWSLSIPRRCGSTDLCKRLAHHFLKQGRTVYWISLGREIPQGAKYFADMTENTLDAQCVLIVDGLCKWDQRVIEAGGIVVVAHPGCLSLIKDPHTECRELVA